MYKVVITVAEPYEKTLKLYMDASQWDLCFAKDNDFVDLSVSFEADFLLLQAQAFPAFYRKELMRLYKSGHAPHIVLFYVGSKNTKNQFASSASPGETSLEFNEALHQLYRVLFLAILHTNNIGSSSFQFVECGDIAKRVSRFAHEEHLREIISGVTREQYLDIINEQNLNLASKGHYLLVAKAMPYDYFDDYTHNRRVYYLLDELLNENIRQLLDEYSGGEIFEASKNSRCIIINDFHRVSSRKLKEDFDTLMTQIHRQIDDGMTALFLGRHVDNPENFNLVYRECIIAKRMRIFFGEKEIMPVSILKQKHDPPDLDRLEECLSLLRTYTVTSDEEEMKQCINYLFLNILKSSANINIYYYSCSALNVIYDSFCSKYGIETEQRAINRCFDKYVTVEEMASHYIHIFSGARQRVLSCYDHDSLLTFQMINYIQHNYNKEITLENLAAHVGLSKCYASKYFRLKVGSTFSEYLTNYRIEKAKELLSAPNHMKVADIASATGYQSPQFFAKTFKQKTGMSPTEFSLR